MIPKLNSEQTLQLIYITLSTLSHDINHCIGAIDIIKKNKFIDGIKIEAPGRETTLGQILDYQKDKLEGIRRFFENSESALYKSGRKNIPDKIWEKLLPRKDTLNE